MQRMVEECPEDPLSHVAFGMVLAELGRFEDAIPHFQKAVDLDPDDPSARDRLGAMYANLNRWDEGEPCFLRALDDAERQGHHDLAARIALHGATNAVNAGQPGRDPTWLDRARDYATRGLGLLALQHGDKAGQRAEYARVLAWRSRANALAGLQEAARSDIEQARSVLPDDPDLLQDHLTCLTIAKDWSALEALLTPLVQRGQHLEHTLTTLVGLLMTQGRTNEISRWLQPLLDLGPSAGALPHRLAAVVLRDQGQHRAAIDFLRQAISIKPSNKDAWLELADLLWSRHDYDDAIDAASQLVERFDDPAGYGIRAEALVDLGRPADAMPDVRVALKRGFHATAFLSRAAEAASKTGDNALAEAAYTRLVAQDFDDSEAKAAALAVFAGFLSALPGREADARQRLDEVQKLAPDHDSVRRAALELDIRRLARDPAADVASLDLSHAWGQLAERGPLAWVGAEDELAVLQRVLRSPAAPTESRFAAGTLLASTRLKAGATDRAVSTIREIVALGMPPPAFANTVLSLRVQLYSRDDGPPIESLDRTVLAGETNRTVAGQS